jgi:hypothetical protein
VEGLVIGFVRLILYIFRSAWSWLGGLGSEKWPLVEASVTSDPIAARGTLNSTVEITFSYRFEGELYTGLHEEPCLLSESEYMDRFAKGRSFVLRVNPRDPGLSLLRDKDQSKKLSGAAEVDEQRDRKVARL